MSLLKEHSNHLVDVSWECFLIPVQPVWMIPSLPRGNISQKNKTNKNVHCTQSASSSLHSIWRSSVHSPVLCHPLMYSSWMRESLFSYSLWRMTPLETAFSLCWYSLLHQSRANQRVSEGTGPQRFNLQEWICWVDVRTLLSIGGQGCPGTSAAMSWQIVWMTTFFETEASILTLWSLLRSLGVWLRLLLPKYWTKLHLLPEGYLESCPVPLFRDKSL